MKKTIVDAADDKKLARKAKRAAKRAARLEKLQKQREAKKAKREAKKAKHLAKLEKEKQRKAAIREKKRLAREKKREALLAKKLKAKERAKKAELKAKERNFKNAFNKARKDTDALDAKAAAKQMNSVLSQIAKEIANADEDARRKTIKRLSAIGYSFINSNGNLAVSFYAEKSKKLRGKANDIAVVDEPAVEDSPAQLDAEPSDFEADDEEPKVELVPAGDLLRTDGNAEVANLDADEETDEDDDLGTNDEDYFDSRDEQDEDLVESRREYFSGLDENGEEIDE